MTTGLDNTDAATVVLRHNPVHQGQSHPPPSLFGGETRLENLFPNPSGNSLARIGNQDANSALGMIIHLQGDGPFAIDQGIDSIFDEILENPPQQVADETHLALNGSLTAELNPSAQVGQPVLENVSELIRSLPLSYTKCTQVI